MMMVNHTCSKTELFKFEQRGLPGDMLVYYTGPYLPEYPTEAERDVINRIRYLSNIGQIDLTQKRMGDRCYEYRATWRKMPAKMDHLNLRLPMI
jgi:hypothetical protein